MMHFHSYSSTSFEQSDLRPDDYQQLDLPKVSNLILQDMNLIPFTPEQLFFLQMKQVNSPDDFVEVQLCFYKPDGSYDNSHAIKLDIDASISELKRIVLT